MGFVNLFLSSPCKLTIKNRQLCVQGDCEHKYPLEDLNSIMVENNQCNVSSSALQSLAQNGVATFFCDKKHMPNGVLVPFNIYFRQKKTIVLQNEISKPLKKQLWQKIVISKIENQAQNLEFCKCENSQKLYEISKKVLSDDSQNFEAVAANLYFRNLFGKSFVRRQEDFVNAALNYGYTVLRGCIARTLVCYGFEASIGLHHRNELNNFNLADDLIEPFRPIVDLLVFNICKANFCELNPQVKKYLYNVVNLDVEINGQIQSVHHAIELEIQSLGKSLCNGECKLLLPKLMPVALHKYE